jgi:hypothetical protein
VLRAKATRARRPCTRTQSEWRLRERERAVAAERASLDAAAEAAAARDELREGLALRLHHAESELARSAAGGAGGRGRAGGGMDAGGGCGQGLPC